MPLLLKKIRKMWRVRFAGRFSLVDQPETKVNQTEPRPSPSKRKVQKVEEEKSPVISSTNKRTRSRSQKQEVITSPTPKRREGVKEEREIAVKTKQSLKDLLIAHSGRIL